jgi:ABC-type tungstate transport system permease subunit
MEGSRLCRLRRTDRNRNSRRMVPGGGQGHGGTLVMASEMGAYTLTDIGTFLAYQSDLQLVPVVDSGSILLNVYTVLVCAKSTKQEMADNWWPSSPHPRFRR